MRAAASRRPAPPTLERLTASRRPAPPTLERLTASLVPDRLEAHAARLPPSTLILAYQTLVRGYLERDEQASCDANMLAFLARRPAGAALWMELEIDDGRRRLPAALIAHARAGDTVHSFRLGRMHQHPSDVEVDADGVAALRARLAAPMGS